MGLGSALFHDHFGTLTAFRRRGKERSLEKDHRARGRAGRARRGGGGLLPLGRGVDILDCETVSRAVEPLLDEADPIQGSYTFEVSSAGAERALKRPSDFQQFMGSPVTVKTYQARNGRKEFAGTLAGYDEATGDVTVTVGKETMVFPKSETALVRLRVEF